MALDIAVQMDPIESIAIAGDSSFALMLEAQRRGHEIFIYHPAALSFQNQHLTARGNAVELRDVQGDHFTAKTHEQRDLSGFDAILMRQDPPFDMGYISACHLLEHIHPKTLVVNDPVFVRDSPEKLVTLHFSDFMPPTLVSRDVADIQAFRKEYRDIIIKPLNSNGGEGVFRITPDDENMNALLELYLRLYREPLMIQAYLPDVRKGDKRIILVDGEPAGALNRVPAKGEARSNLHVGGRAEKADLTPHEREICAALGPFLKERGLIFVGIDVIGKYLTEINVTSPTGIREIKAFGGPDIAAMIWDAIENRL